MVGRRGGEPGSVGELVVCVVLAAAADEGAAAAGVQAEPRGPEGAVHDVEPEGDFGQFYGGGVEVDAVAVVQGDVGLDLLQFGAVLVRVDADPEFGLAAAQVFGGHLVDGLVEEGTGTEGRFADGPGE